MSSDSSSEEDGDAERRAAIASIVSTSSFSTSSKLTTNGTTATSQNSNHSSTDDRKTKLNPQFKFAQIRAQKMLDSIIEKTLEIVNEPTPAGPEEPAIEEGGVRLFRDAPVGIVFDHIVELQGPTKRPRILPGEEINKKSKKFKKQIKSVVVDGSSIMSAAKDACEKSLLRLQDKEARAKAAAKKEEERVAELKKIRGEKWLPSIARDKASSKHNLKQQRSPEQQGTVAGVSPGSPELDRNFTGEAAATDEGDGGVRSGGEMLMKADLEKEGEETRVDDWTKSTPIGSLLVVKRDGFVSD